MGKIFLIFFVIFIIPQISFSSSGDFISTGNSGFDNSLTELNKIMLNGQRKFIYKLSKEYQVPPDKIADLVNSYKFSPANTFMTVAISDLTGQPISIVSRAYLENKKQGWRYVLEQLNISINSVKFKQLINDLNLFITAPVK